MPLILEALGFSTDNEGYLTEDGERSIATDGKQILTKDVAAFSKDGVHRGDLYSLMQLAGQRC